MAIMMMMMMAEVNGGDIIVWIGGSLEGRPLMGLTMGSQRQLRPRVRLYRHDGFRFHFATNPCTTNWVWEWTLALFAFIITTNLIIYLQLILPRTTQRPGRRPSNREGAACPPCRPPAALLQQGEPSSTFFDCHACRTPVWGTCWTTCRSRSCQRPTQTGSPGPTRDPVQAHVGGRGRGTLQRWRRIICDLK